MIRKKVAGASSSQDSPKPEQNAPATLVPKLRFPEFRGAKGWQPTTLGEEASILKGKGISKADLDPNGAQLCIRYGELYTRYGESIKEAVSRTAVPLSELFLSKRDDVIIPSSGETKIDIAKASCVLAANIALGGDLNVIRSKLNGTFLSYYLNGPKRFAIAKVAQGDTVVHLYPHQLEALRIAFPSSAEQQKIAECLSSLDELMAAQARKVDALKTHKKGLLQKLFPPSKVSGIENIEVRSEKKSASTFSILNSKFAIPPLRFPEFQNAGEWARMSIQEMIDKQLIVGHLDGNHGELYPKAEEFSPNKEGIPYITANDFINGTVEFSRCKRLPLDRARLFKKGVAKDGDILFAHNATVGPVAKLNTEEEFVILSTTATYFRCNSKHLSNDFLKSALSSPDFVAQYSRVMSQSTRNQVPITTQRKLELHVPKPPEQQRIASCLSSLDALITAEAQKLEALKRHKKGLMQQLFPSPEEVEA